MKGGRRLIICESCIRSEENSLDWYLKAAEELLVGAKTVGVIELIKLQARGSLERDELMKG